MADATENVQPRLHSVVLPERAQAVGRTLTELGLDARVQVRGVRRRGGRLQRPGPDWEFEDGDIVVLLGRATDLSHAEQKLLG
jgi:monovalent cation:H+ antiporter-2, CPA2 family